MAPPDSESPLRTAEERPPSRALAGTRLTGTTDTLTLKEIDIKDIARDTAAVESNGVKEEDIILQLQGAGLPCKLRIILSLALPVIASYLLYSTTSFVILYFAGHLSSEANDPTIFAGISMANMFANVSCFSILIGMTSSVETLGSQNNGARNFREVGLVLQRSVFVLSTMLVPIAVMWLYAEELFLALGTDHGICVVMGRFLRVRMATMPVDVLFKSYEKYLCCLGLTKPAMYSQLAAIVGTAGLGWLFVRRFHGGFESLAWAFVISTYLSFACLFGSSYYHPAVQRTQITHQTEI